MPLEYNGILENISITVDASVAGIHRNTRGSYSETLTLCRVD